MYSILVNSTLNFFQWSYKTQWYQQNILDAKDKLITNTLLLKNLETNISEGKSKLETNKICQVHLSRMLRGCIGGDEGRGMGMGVEDKLELGSLFQIKVKNFPL